MASLKYREKKHRLNKGLQSSKVWSLVEMTFAGFTESKFRNTVENNRKTWTVIKKTLFFISIVIATVVHSNCDVDSYMLGEY